MGTASWIPINVYELSNSQLQIYLHYVSSVDMLITVWDKLEVIETKTYSDEKGVRFWLRLLEGEFVLGLEETFLDAAIIATVNLIRENMRDKGDV